MVGFDDSKRYPNKVALALAIETVRSEVGTTRIRYPRVHEPTKHAETQLTHSESPSPQARDAYPIRGVERRAWHQK